MLYISACTQPMSKAIFPNFDMVVSCLKIRRWSSQVDSWVSGTRFGVLKCMFDIKKIAPPPHNLFLMGGVCVWGGGGGRSEHFILL